MGSRRVGSARGLTGSRSEGGTGKHAIDSYLSVQASRINVERVKNRKMRRQDVKKKREKEREG